jgi:hypothetical protein
MTEPAARGTFSATVTQWAIFDAYEEERANVQGTSAAAVVSASGSSSTSSTVVSTATGPVSNVPKTSDTSKVFRLPNSTLY